MTRTPASRSGAPIHWVLVDCLSGQVHRIGKLPLEIELDPEDTGSSHNAIGCSLTLNADGTLTFIPGTNIPFPCILNGERSETTILKPGNDYLVSVASHHLLVHGAIDIDAWLQSLDFGQWFIQTPKSLEPLGPYRLEELPSSAPDTTDASAFPKGLSIGFPLGPLLLALDPSGQPRQATTARQSTDGVAPDEDSLSINAESGELVCPVCWLHFDYGDVMHLAVHESLRGDPILGEDVPQRFYATHFNEKGQALDAMNVPCTDLACPHCRRKLPYGFLDTPHHILSIVGAPSSGKSYYLSVLVKVLQNALYRHFRVTFKDSDPSGNALLNEMKNQLFGSKDPKGAALIKTQLEGVMYERLPRYGREVALPKPFVFQLVSETDPTRKASLVFYDNAGEHFEPGINTHESPGAQHVAASAGIFFLFDPTSSVDFRARLGQHSDPQLALSQRLDQQDTILSEMEVRLKNLLGLRATDHSNKPLAMLIGKCDVWLNLIGADNLHPTVVEGVVDFDAIDANSRLVRGLLEDICPSIVANAESISSNVRYFPVSALGHSPIKLPDGRLAPDPTRLSPQYIEIPTLWLLAQATPWLVPSKSG